jgi:hypothetical protein
MVLVYVLLIMMAGAVIGAFGFSSIFQYYRAAVKPAHGLVKVIAWYVIIAAGAFVFFFWGPITYGIIGYAVGILIGLAPYLHSFSDPKNKGDSETENQ